ncbi:MAG: inorganic diphosphatase [Oligoflexia bacterium]|nr:inorganic diphosphatase [Oligoflexia bacterium]
MMLYKRLFFSSVFLLISVACSRPLVKTDGRIMDELADNIVFYTPEVKPGRDKLLFAVEIPRGSDRKYEFRTATGSLFLDRTICENKSGKKFPVNYGISPGRFNVDGDPVDLIVLGMEEEYKKQVESGKIVPRAVRVVGLVKMEECDHVPCQTDRDWEQDYKIIAVDIRDAGMKNIYNISDVNRKIKKEIVAFWSNYKGLKNGFPQTRVKNGTRGFSSKYAALKFIKQFKYFDKNERDREINQCNKIYKAVLTDRERLSEIQPEKNDPFIKCLGRTLYRGFFDDTKVTDFFIRYSAYQLLRFKLKNDEATVENSLKLMNKLKTENKKHYRFISFDKNGTGNPVYEWVKTKDRGCRQHYDDLPLIY